MNKRLFWPDFLRVFALLGMIVIHISAIGWNELSVTSFQWQSLHLWDALTRSAVPLFIMISGYFMLNPNRPFSFKRLYFKNIKRIALAFFIWSILYALVDKLRDQAMPLQLFFSKVIHGHYHMWFLISLIGIYIYIPIFRLITQDRKTTVYAMLLMILTSSLLPFYSTVLALPMPEPLAFFLRVLNLSNGFGLGMFFISGYYLGTINITKWVRLVAYSTGLAALILTEVLNSYLSLKSGKPTEMFFNYLVPLVVITAFALFILVRDVFEHLHLPSFFENSVHNLATNGLGIYLISAVPVELVNLFAKERLLSEPLLYIPLFALLSLMFCAICAAIMRKIPLINRYLL